MKVIEYHGRRFACTLTDCFRRHTAEEREAMRESLAAPRGLLNPVRLYDDDDLELSDCVLDGEGRLELCADLGLPLDPDAHFVHMGRMGTAAAYELAKAFNDARRQDDPAAVRRRRAERVKRVAEARAEGQSLRTIAEREGVSKTQVEEDLKAATVQGWTVNPEQVIGRDGRGQPATRPKPEPQADERSPAELLADLEPADEQTPGEAAEPPRRSMPKHSRPGNKADPNHPYAALLNRISALAGDITEAANAEGNAKLKQYLTDARLLDHFVKLDARTGKETQPRYVGLRDLRRVVKLAGLPGKAKTREQLLKELASAEDDE